MSKENKKVLLVILGVVLLILLVVFSISLIKNNNKDDNEKTTTTITTTGFLEKKLENSGVVLTYEKNDVIKDNYKLIVKSLEDNINLENVLAVYDINIVDSNNKVVKISNNLMKISIPFKNVDNYSSFNVLHLNDNNEVLETLNATYQNNKIIFSVNHLSRFAIVGVKEELVTTTSSTTKKNTVKTTRKQTTTKKREETTTTTKEVTTQTTTTTTKATTQATTTQKIKTYTYEWSLEGDQAGKYYLYIIDENGVKVAGTVTLTSKATGSSKTFDIPASGRLFVKDNYTVSNPKGN